MDRNTGRPGQGSGLPRFQKLYSQAKIPHPDGVGACEYGFQGIDISSELTAEFFAMRGEQDMPAVNFLIKPASGMCNLRCKYCFYDDIGDNRSVKNMGMMRPETARLLIAE